MTLDGQTIIAPLPEGIDDHVGPELKRFILVQYHQGQTTMPRLVALLQMLGLTISERQVVRVLNEAKGLFIEEARDVLRTAFKTAAWISVDDTGARHKGTNGFCTQMGNDLFTFFATTASKSRLNFLGLLRAGHTDYVLNNAAFAYMTKRNLAGAVIAKQEHPLTPELACIGPHSCRFGGVQFAIGRTTSEVEVRLRSSTHASRSPKA